MNTQTMPNVEIPHPADTYDQSHEQPSASHYSNVVTMPVKNSGNGKSHINYPIVASQIEARLGDKEREELHRQFSRRDDIPFNPDEHHPILKKCHDLIAPIVNTKPQTIITPLLPAFACNIGNGAFTTAYGDPVFCNIWTIVMGPSSIARKTTSLNKTLGPLHQIEREYYEEYKRELKNNPETPPIRKRIIFPTATAERFGKILSENPNGLLTYNEIASMLKKMGKSYNNDLKSDFVDWFDSPEMKGHETQTYETILDRPCFSISTATTKEWIIDNLEASDLQSGFMQRFLLCNNQDIKREEVNTRIYSGKQSMVEINNYLGTLYNRLRQLSNPKHPLEIILSEEAIDLHDKLNGEVLDQIFAEYNNALFSFWARYFTGYFLRFCILFTLLELAERQILWKDYDVTASDLIVSESTAGYALKLCHYYFQSIRAFLQNEASQTFNSIERKIVDVFHSFKSEAGPERTLPHTFVKVKSSIRKTADFKDAINNLIELGVIQKRSLKKEESKKMVMYYTLTI